MGFSKVDITPSYRYEDAWFFYEVISEGVHDSLYVNAFVFKQGNIKYAIAGCDVAMVSPEVCNAVREQVVSIGIPLEHVLINASETHNGPDYFGEFYQMFHNTALKEKGFDSAEPIDYSDFLVKRIVQAIKKANDSLISSTIEFARGNASAISFNRRYEMKDGSIGWNPGKKILIL